jgi:hypothetical protein
MGASVLSRIRAIAVACTRQGVKLTPLAAVEVLGDRAGDEGNEPRPQLATNLVDQPVAIRRRQFLGKLACPVSDQGGPALDLVRGESRCWDRS